MSAKKYLTEYGKGKEYPTGIHLFKGTDRDYACSFCSCGQASKWSRAVDLNGKKVVYKSFCSAFISNCSLVVVLLQYPMIKRLMERLWVYRFIP